MSDNLPSKKDQFTLHGFIFSPKDYGIIQASKSDVIKTMDRTISYDFVMMSVVKATRNIGYKNQMPDKDVRYICVELIKWLTIQRNNIRIEEAVLGIDMGSKGEYEDDFYHVSVKSCIFWIKKYMSSKNEVMLEFLEAKEKESVKLAKESDKEKVLEYELKFPGHVQGAFVYHKLIGKLPLSSYAICKGLDKLSYKNNGKGFLSQVITIAEKHEIKKLATHDVLEREKKSMGYAKFALTIRRAAFKVRTDGEIILRCKELALMKYFDNLEVFDMTELKEIVNKLIKDRDVD